MVAALTPEPTIAESLNRIASAIETHAAAVGADVPDPSAVVPVEFFHDAVATAVAAEKVIRDALAQINGRYTSSTLEAEAAAVLLSIGELRTATDY